MSSLKDIQEEFSVLSLEELGVMESMFRKFDEDCDGYLCVSELQAAHAAMGDVRVL